MRNFRTFRQQAGSPRFRVDFFIIPDYKIGKNSLIFMKALTTSFSNNKRIVFYLFFTDLNRSKKIYNSKNSTFKIRCRRWRVKIIIIIYIIIISTIEKSQSLNLRNISTDYWGLSSPCYRCESPIWRGWRQSRKTDPLLLLRWIIIVITTRLSPYRAVTSPTRPPCKRPLPLPDVPAAAVETSRAAVIRTVDRQVSLKHPSPSLREICRASYPAWEDRPTLPPGTRVAVKWPRRRTLPRRQAEPRPTARRSRRSARLRSDWRRRNPQDWLVNLK